MFITVFIFKPGFVRVACTADNCFVINGCRIFNNDHIVRVNSLDELNFKRAAVIAIG